MKFLSLRPTLGSCEVPHEIWARFDVYWIQTTTDKGLKGTVVNLTCLSMIGRSLEIMLPIPLRFFFYKNTSPQGGIFEEGVNEKLDI